MNGLIIVNKPQNITSRDVVNNLNHIFGLKKIGHTGTLDPIATGVLVCLIGKYTKLVDLITSYDKEYIAEIKLGIKTNTGDISGTIISEEKVNIKKKDILKVFKKYLGTYKQEVPSYSAVKINGKKLYEYARENIKVKLPTRQVTIYNLELLEFNNDIIKFKTKVSKGTYIRSLINDLCSSLNTIGTMQSLCRIKQGNFELKDAFTLEDIKNNNYKLLNIRDFLDYPVYEIDEKLFKKISNGMMIPNTFNIKSKVIFTYKNKEIAIYELKEKYLKSYLQF